MLVVFVLVAILVHRWLPGSRNLKKSVHLCLQGLALASGIFGIWTKFHSQDGVVANFYSLHSWMGLICISLFGTQVYQFPPFPSSQSLPFYFLAQNTDIFNYIIPPHKTFLE